jgi:uncharacterized protein (TIGR02147 family)
MKNDVFDYPSYKAYLVDWIEAQGRGSRSRMAAALGCHTAYITQILNHDAHLSPEQAEELNRFARHSREESEFFLLLVQHARAGTRPLQSRLRDQIKAAREKRLLLRNRARIEKTPSPTDQMTYYSSWMYAAVHVLISIPAFRTPEAISRQLGITLPRVQEILDFLCHSGMAAREGAGFRPGVTRLFLPSDSPIIAKHHTNWRVKAIESLDRGGSADLHLSTVLSLSRDDVDRIKELLISAIEEARRVARESPEEELHCFNLDFFQL